MALKGHGMSDINTITKYSADLARAIEALRYGGMPDVSIEDLEERLIASVRSSSGHHPSMLAFTVAKSHSARALATLPKVTKPCFVLYGKDYSNLISYTSPAYVELAVSRGLSVTRHWNSLCHLASTDPAWERTVVEVLATSHCHIETFCEEWERINAESAPHIFARVLRQQVQQFPREAIERSVQAVWRNQLDVLVLLYLAGTRLSTSHFETDLRGPSYAFLEEVQGGHRQMKIAQVLPDLEALLENPDLIRTLPMFE
jgi:hypothetical protein